MAFEKWTEVFKEENKEKIATLREIRKYISTYLHDRDSKRWQEFDKIQHLAFDDPRALFTSLSDKQKKLTEELRISFKENMLDFLFEYTIYIDEEKKPE